MPNIVLLENRVLVKKIEEKQAGGIELPEGTGSDINHFTGDIRRIGPDCKSVKEGDVVIFRDGYSKVILQGEEFYILRESNVVGIIKNHVE